MDVTGAIWRKSSRSGSNGGACVEVAQMPNGIGVRDSKNPHAGHLSVTTEAFGNLLAGIRSGKHGV
jgi:uncharacterized protein DUF397